ncbi:MAG: HD domain-containing protein [Candidatus Aenigmarchaeota archaeon]|nr:HD domain-containing protein [Candidatus Aenigmarchaeota archaeon]
MALTLLKENLKKEHLLKHCLAVEAIMRGLAACLRKDQEQWGLVGLVHDIDFERIRDTSEHGIIAEEILKDDVDKDVIRAVKSHNFENTGIQPETRMENALIAADAVSGLVVACALVMPSKRLADVSLDTLKEKFKSKDFARNCSREKILYCEKIDLEKEKFFEIALNSLKNISDELGL